MNTANISLDKYKLLHIIRVVQAFDVLGDPVRRRILELLAGGELAAGQVGGVVQDEFGISQPAVSQHLRVLRDNGFATVRAEGTRRLYAVDAAPLQEVDAWLETFRRFWTQRLDALGTELVRGRRRGTRTQAGGHQRPDQREPTSPPADDNRSEERSPPP